MAPTNCMHSSRTASAVADRVIHVRLLSRRLARMLKQRHWRAAWTGYKYIFLNIKKWAGKEYALPTRAKKWAAAARPAQ